MKLPSFSLLTKLKRQVMVTQVPSCGSLDSICSLCSLGLAPAGLQSPHGLEPGSPRCPEGMSTQPLVSPHCPVLGASEMKFICVLLPNLSRVSPVPLRPEATPHLFSDSPYDINVFGGKFLGTPYFLASDP